MIKAADCGKGQPHSRVLLHFIASSFGEQFAAFPGVSRPSSPLRPSDPPQLSCRGARWAVSTHEVQIVAIPCAELLVDNVAVKNVRSSAVRSCISRISWAHTTYDIPSCKASILRSTNANGFSSSWGFLSITVGEPSLGVPYRGNRLHC